MRPRDPIRTDGDGINMSAHLINVAKTQERFFGIKYQELPTSKLASLKKWGDWAKQDNPRYPIARAVQFMEGVERCISGELRLLLEMSGDELPERLFRRFDDDDIPDLLQDWKARARPGGLTETYARFKEGKLPMPKEVDRTTTGSLTSSFIAFASVLTFPERPSKRARTQKSSTELNSEPDAGMNIILWFPSRVNLS